MNVSGQNILVLDVGTNSLKALFARVANGQIVETLWDERATTRLGAGVHATGLLQQAAIGRTTAAMAGFVGRAQAGGADAVRIVATSAAREAKNADALDRAVRALCDFPLAILSGADEARLSFLGAAGGTGKETGVWDVGGGSTEWIAGRGGTMSYRHSFPMGALRVTEAYLPGDLPAPASIGKTRDALRATFDEAPDFIVEQWMGVGGSACTMASVALQGAGVVEGFALRRAEVERHVETYSRLTTEERRRLPGMEADRAPIILGGGLVLLACMERAGADVLTVTTRGLRHGVALEEGEGEARV